LTNSFLEHDMALLIMHVCLRECHQRKETLLKTKFKDYDKDGGVEHRRGREEE
jgi:hypothetical protein